MTRLMTAALCAGLFAMGCGNNGFTNQAPPSGDIPPTGGSSGRTGGFGGSGSASGSASGSGSGSSVGDFDAGTVAVDMRTGCSSDAECALGQSCIVFDGIGSCRATTTVPTP